jgi:hypothetical protein
MFKASAAPDLACGFRLSPPRPHPDAEASLLFLSNEACRHQLHQPREIAVRQPVTGKGTRALDQIAQLGIGCEVNAKAIDGKRLELARTTT